MDTLEPGHYWKTPFAWEPGSPAAPNRRVASPEPIDRLTFGETDPEWLERAVAQVMATSLDRANRHAVETLGADRAARDLLALGSSHFHVRPEWWRTARDASNDAVGFVLPVLFREEDTPRDGRHEATILFMGVLPQFRGRGYAVELLRESVRIVREASCWRMLCDTDSGNLPMVSAFRRAGFVERDPWKRPYM